MTIRQWCPLTRSAEILGDRWCLLILRELACGPQRFKDFKKNITGISMDQLTRKLDHLCRNFIIVRQGFSEAPPRVEYQLTEKGRTLMPVIRRVFLWGSQEAWGQNEKSEIVDVALTLRLVASFLGQGEGTLFVKILRADSYWVQRTQAGQVHVFQKSERQDLIADAQLEMGLSDWVKLIARNSQEVISVVVRIEGDRKILENILPLFRGVKISAVPSPGQSARPPEISL